MDHQANLWRLCGVFFHSARISHVFGVRRQFGRADFIPEGCGKLAGGNTPYVYGAGDFLDLNEVESNSPGSRRISDAALGSGQTIFSTLKGSHKASAQQGLSFSSGGMLCDPFRVEDPCDIYVFPGSADPGLLNAIPLGSRSRATLNTNERDAQATGNMGKMPMPPSNLRSPFSAKGEA
jgi:hypothetical protein